MKADFKTRFLSPLVLSALIASILLASSLTSQAQQSVASANWPDVQGPFHAGYSPQNVINAGNVQSLSAQWIFPVPSAPPVYAANAGNGVIHTPLIINGIVYFVTDWHRVFAVSATDGHLIWFKDLPTNSPASLSDLEHFQSVFNGCALSKCGSLGHYHAIYSTEKILNQELIWIPGNDWHLYALNALTGDLIIDYPMLTLQQFRSTPGNYGLYGIGESLAIDEEKSIIIFGSESGEAVASGRGFFEALDVSTTTPRVLWRTFMIPPQDGSDPNWALESVANMSYAYIFDGKNQVNLKSLSQSQLNSMLSGDWGTFGFNGTHSFAGANPGWGGSWQVDKQTHIAYVGTAEPAPDFNATFRPGPNLWSDSIMALDVATGKIVWGFETTAHDLYDWDCSWGVILTNATVNGASTKTVLKGCKNGYLYALDAATGKLLWNLRPPDTKYTPGTFGTAGTLLNDPLNPTDMHRIQQCAPAKSCTQFPGGTGGLESNFAYDPSRNMVVITGYNYGGPITIYDVCPKKCYTGFVKPVDPYLNDTGANTFPGVPGTGNATVYGIDAGTGKVNWKYQFNLPFRGGISVSGGVVFVPAIDGVLRLIDEDNGKLIQSRIVGGTMITEPAIGADANGQTRVIVPAGAGIFWGSTDPGYVIAYGISPQAIQTVTTTFVSTQSSSGPPTGIEPSAFYAAVGVAVIFVIATGLLAVRRRRPVS